MFAPPEEVQIGQRWKYMGSSMMHHGREHVGACVVVAENDSPESPESWVMRSEVNGKTYYMHRSARLAGEWKRLSD